MFISLLEINQERVRNRYEIHRLLWKSFPGIPEASRPFLFRVEGRRAGKSVILMQSSIKPVQPEELGFHLIGTKEFQPRLVQDQVVRFSLCANPVKRLSLERCRVPLIKDDELTGWLERKMNGAAHLLECRISGIQNLYFRKNAGVGSPGKITAVTFTGVLQVSSPEALLSELQKGIGPAKSFGCGLLSLARGA